MHTLVLCLALLATPPADRVQLHLDTSEADAVLAIVEKDRTGGSLAGPDWQRLFNSEPYVRLKKREAGLHRDFTDEQFKKFVLSAETRKQAPELHRTLDAWKKADLKGAAQRILGYLPPGATIRTSVYPVIKPMHNSFVFETDTDNPAIFLYVDPATSAAGFAVIVAHEMHHIGYSSTGKEYEKKIASLPEGPRKAAEWMGAFGEGMAMLAASGGPGRDPVATYTPELQAEWKRDMADFASDFQKVQQFFADVADGRVTNPEEINKRAYEFFGSIGPWYSVGYRMAVLVEERYGRAVLIRCMEDPRSLLAAYNRVASEKNAKNDGEKLPLWSPELLAKVQAAAAE